MVVGVAGGLQTAGNVGEKGAGGADALYVEVGAAADLGAGSVLGYAGALKRMVSWK